MTRPTIVFVLGAGRSGTSALTRVLSLCGATLPPGMLGAISTNRRGCWEPREVIAINQAIRHRRAHGSGWDLGLTADADSVAAVTSYLAGLPAAPVTVIKEPTLTALSSIWFEGARRAGYDVAAIIPVRHPGDCTRSAAALAAAQNYVQSSPELSGAGWLKHSLLAERVTREIPRVFVDYTALLDDWRTQIKRMAVELGIELHQRNEDVIEAFLAPDLRHHHYQGPVIEPFGGDWMATVYGALGAATRDEPFDSAELDRVYTAYRDAEQGFRVAFAGLSRYRNVNRLLHPTLVRWTLSALGRLHGNTGTWA